jgi:hypothetical protein
MYNTLKSGMLTPFTFRYFDMGKRKAWPGARDAIMHEVKLMDERAKLVLAQKAKEEKAKKAAR